MKLMQFHDVEQNTDEWLDMRIGKLTGSGCSKIMASSNEYMVILVGKDLYRIANTKTKKLLKKPYGNKIEAENALIEIKEKDLKKSFGLPAQQMAVNIAIEQLTESRSLSSGYNNEHMERGHEQEPMARRLYEDRYFVDVTNGGFFDCGNTGCSPDGLVCDDGLIEIKSVIPHVHYANIKRGSIDPSYKWQMYFNLMKTDRSWLDFVSYCADYPNESKLYVHRIHRVGCGEQLRAIKNREADFFKLVDEIKSNVGTE